MRRIVAAINMTLDGYCDHTGMIADDELHVHYKELLANAGLILYGRITYELMKYWQDLVQHPSGNQADDEFATTMDKIPKMVFSNTLKKLDWPSAKLATRSLEDEVSALRKQEGEDILVGSRSLIVALLNRGMIDEFQLCIHPVMLGKGAIQLLDKIKERINLTLLKTRTFGSGAVVLYYQPAK